MRQAICIICLVLAGCASSPDTPATLPPVQPGASTPVDVYADAADLVMDRAAASVQVARKANQDGKPAVVESELGVAASILPRPSPKEVGKATARASKADPKEYDAAAQEADRKQRELDSLWGQVEAEKEKARQQVLAKQQELDAERAKVRDLLWSCAGIILVMVGGAGFIWGSAFGVSKVEAVAISLLGFVVGSLPWILESDLSAWIVAPAAGLVLLRGVVWLWGKGWRKPKPQVDFGKTLEQITKENPTDGKAQDRLP